MIEYTKDVADRVLRILQASGQVDADKLKEVMVEAQSRSGRALAIVMKELVDEELVMSVLSRAYALRRKNLTPDEIEIEAVTSIPNQLILDEHILPFAREGRFLRIGTVDPTKATLANHIKAISNQNV